MNPAPHNRPFLSLARLILLAALCFNAFAGLAQPAAAQQTSIGEWSAPANLSSNGTAVSPEVIADSLGGLHAIWIDSFDGMVYSRFTGEIWLPAVAPTFPFAAFLPKFLADQKGNVHAFWLDKQGGLFYSRVAAGDFGTAAWSQAFRLTDSAVTFAAALDSLDRLHVVFVRTQSVPGFAPGAYYRRSFTGDAWFPPVSIYETAYFRSLTAANAHVSIAVTDQDTSSATPGRGEQEVYIAVDNRPRERVLLAKSSNSGETWGAPVEIDKPGVESGSRGASYLMVYADGPKVMLLWQASVSGAACSQFYQFSSDGGAIWSSRQSLDSASAGCPAQARLLAVSKPGAQTNPSRQYALLINENQQQVTLRMWDGTGWGASQDQPVLSYFVDPDTQRTVTFACRQFSVGVSFQLYAAGCDTGGGGDVWMLSRSLDGLASSNAETQIWSSPQLVVSDLAPALDPVLVAGANGVWHALWSQADLNQPVDTGDAIYYSQWNGQTWSRPLQALRSPEGKANQPAVALDADGRLLVVWSGGRSGEIYYSWANADRASSALEWNPPVRLQAGSESAAPGAPRRSGSRPQILVDGAGQIAVAFAAPFNEGRGIYVARSSGDGAVWSPPVQVFDAAAAGWERVDEPRLALASDGGLALLWTAFSLPGGQGPLALFYSRSADGGLTWSPAEMIVEKPVQWTALLPGSGDSLHRLWQEVESEQRILWHQISLDGGITWDQATTVPSLGGLEGPAAVQADSLGRLQLVRVNRDLAASFVLRHLQWEAGRWTSQGELASPGSLDISNMRLSLGVAPDGALSVLYTRLVLPVGSGQIELVDASRSIALIEGAVPRPRGVMPALTGAAGSQVTPTPIGEGGSSATAEPTNATPATPQATLTPTPTVDNQPVPPQSALTGVILWVLPASLLVGAVFVGALLYNWLKNRY